MIQYAQIRAIAVVMENATYRPGLYGKAPGTIADERATANSTKEGSAPDMFWSLSA
jgi:hypothetical protein